MSGPNWRKHFCFHVDACPVSVGGTLPQLNDNGQERAITYFSMRMFPAEENYSANDRELLGVIYFFTAI